jgi:hypothetical protein
MIMVITLKVKCIYLEVKMINLKKYYSKNYNLHYLIV